MSKGLLVNLCCFQFQDFLMDYDSHVCVFCVFMPRYVWTVWAWSALTLCISLYRPSFSILLKWFWQFEPTPWFWVHYSLFDIVSLWDFYWLCNQLTNKTYCLGNKTAVPIVQVARTFKAGFMSFHFFIAPALHKGGVQYILENVLSPQMSQLTHKPLLHCFHSSCPLEEQRTMIPILFIYIKKSN